MKPLTRADLFSLERYAELRSEFRARVLAHKKARQVAVGPHATLYFEDRLTIQYQVQEMLRIERIFEADGIADELSAYNPLIPDGRNWKATFMLEYPDPEERRQALGRLIGIEDRVWVQAAGCARVWAIADEDLERERADKTASVHFVRFEFDADTLAALRAGAAVELGIDHDHYRYALRLAEATRTALLADLD